MGAPTRLGSSCEEGGRAYRVGRAGGGEGEGWESLQGWEGQWGEEGGMAYMVGRAGRVGEGWESLQCWVVGVRRVGGPTGWGGPVG